MASSSNSSTALVTSSRKHYYDVFVTFRGEDIRNNFTDCLFDALETNGIMVFRDDTNYQKGEFIGPELIRAIEGSQVFVAVFSRNYASSTWCLQELEKICECVTGSKNHVLPIFYDVDPSEVRKQTMIYCEAFVKHEQRFQQDPQKVSRWREALKQVGSISGWDLRDKPHAGEIKKIVQKIMNILECNSSFVSKDLVGIESHTEALQNHLFLDSVDGVRAIGICGMGGIGKTTLAMTLYGQICHQFSASYFKLNVQKQILFQTLGIKHHQICNRYSATDLIRRRLCRVKALLIFDNVDQVEQLEKIAVHRQWLGAGSRIIIISRDEHVLKEYGVDVVYKVPLLNWTESHKLFYQKAFRHEKLTSSNYQELAYEILEYAYGLPLAIKILGSYLFGRDVSEWKSALARLRQRPQNDVMDVLQLSFDGLRETEKDIFLHIACFFKSLWREKYVKNVLNCCGFHADIGLRILVDKSLISINHSTIQIHSLLVELGRKIVQENSSKHRRKWSRLWSSNQLNNVMMEKMEKHVEAIVLDAEGIDMNVEHFSKMDNLRLLIISKYSGNILKSPSCLSNELRYVECYKYPFMYLPSNFQPNQLVELILKRSDIKQLWEKMKYLPKLRRLDLSDSRKLEKIIDFGEFPNLEKLNLKGCINLVELNPSIGLLKKIVYLNLKDCENLVRIPNNIFDLSSLEYLNMCGCSKVFNNPKDINESTSDSRSASSVFKWLLHNSSLPTPMENTYFLPSMRNLYCLRNVDFSFCHLSQVPDAIECLHWLERLNLGGNNFLKLPSLRKLSKLEYLNLEHCRLLESLPQLPFSTTIGRDHHEHKFFWAGLVIFNCPKLGDWERCSSMTFSWMAQFIQTNPQSYPTYFDRIQIVTPGSEIPSWIDNQSVGGSISIDKSPIMHANNNNIIGFVCCVVFSMAPHRGWTPSSAHLELLFDPIDSYKMSVTVILNGVLVTAKLSHLWIIYFPREFYSEFGKIHFDIIRGEGLGMEVKSCGYRWVCKQDLQEFNSNAQCKILAIEDES